MPIDTVLFQTTALATPPAGQKVAVDNLPSGAGAAQYMKLLSGVPDTEIPIEGDASGLWVNLKQAVALSITPSPLPVNGTVNIGTLPAVVLGAAPATVIGTVRNQDGSGNPLTSTASALDVNLKTSAITLPVSAATLPLPTGAATSARQAVPGAAGTASAEVLTIQGIAGMTPITITGSVTAGGVADNAAFADGTTPVSPAGYIFDEVAGPPLTENDVGASRMDVKRAQVLVLEDGTLRGQRAVVNGSGALLVAPTSTNVDSSAYSAGLHSVTPGGFVLDEVAGAGLLENQVAAARIDPKRAQVLVLEDGTTRGQRAAVSSGGALKVDGSGVTQPVSGAFFQGTQPVSIAAAQVAVPTWGHGVTAAAVPTGATAEGLRGANALPAAVGNGTLVNTLADLMGRLVNVPLAPRELVADNAITLTGTGETTLLGATAAEFHDLTAVVVSNTSATATRVDFRDTTGGTVRFSLNVPAGATVGFNLPTPRPQGAVNTNWTAQLSVAVTDVRVFAQYVRNR